MSDAISFDLEGMKAVTEIFSVFPLNVQKRATKAGYAKAAGRLRTLLRRDAPKGTGNLRRAIKVKRHRNGSFTIGLKERYYYKTLDFMYPRGGEYNPWFEQSVERHAHSTLNLCVVAMHEAISREAGKSYAKSRARIKGRR